MTAILDRCKVTVPEVPAVGDIPAVPAQDYYFLSTHGVYTGDIATTTGVTAEDFPTTDFSSFPLTPVKALMRKEIVYRRNVIVKDSTGKKYSKSLLVADANLTAFPEEIEDKIWPIGKGSGSPIYGSATRTRVVSRR